MLSPQISGVAPSEKAIFLSLVLKWASQTSDLLTDRPLELSHWRFPGLMSDLADV